MPTWCAFVGRLSPLLPPVSRNSWPTSSAGERRWPPSTKFSCGPTRARHKPPPAPPRQMCQLHPPHLSPSENTLPNTSWRDFKGGTSSGKTLGREVGWSLQVWVVELGRKKKKKKKLKKPAVAVICRDVTSFSFLVLMENLKECVHTQGNSYKVTRAWLHFIYGGPCSYKAGCCLQVSTSRFVTSHTFWINYFLSYCQLQND